MNMIYLMFLFSVTYHNIANGSNGSLNLPANVWKKKIRVVRVSSHQRKNVTFCIKWPLKDRLKDAMRSYFYYYSVWRYMFKCFFKENRADEIVGMIFWGTELCQITIPLAFRDRTTNPTRTSLSFFFDNLH